MPSVVVTMMMMMVEEMVAVAMMNITVVAVVSVLGFTVLKHNTQQDTGRSLCQVDAIHTVPGVKGVDLTSQLSHGVVKRKIKADAESDEEKDRLPQVRQQQ